MSIEIQFTKMHGCGNDFVVIDNRMQILQEEEINDFVQTVCERKFHIGANGVMLVEESERADVKMRYFNADGSEGEMCGNGARCFAKFSHELNMVEAAMTMETLDGLYDAQVMVDGNVQISFPEIALNNVHLNKQLVNGEQIGLYHYIWVGVPHVVVFGNNISEIDDAVFAEWAIGVKEQEQFRPHGTNVNLVEICPKTTILKIRTYERGVEEETLACGSGATASAIIASLLGKVNSNVQVETRGGMLTVDFTLQNTSIQHITLKGNAVTVFTGMIQKEGDCDA